MDFVFHHSQLDSEMSNVFKVPTYEDIGLSKGLLKLCEHIHYNYHNCWNHTLHMSFLDYQGFETLHEFKEVYVRAKIYNAIRFNPSQTLRQYIFWHQCKVKQDVGKAVLLKPQSNIINLFDFLMSFSVDELLCCGW